MGIAIIEDGTGSGKKAAVNDSNRITVQGITESEANHASGVGTRFNVNTGPITLTSANESAVFYFKNTGDDPISITSFIYNFGTSTGGSGDWLASIYRNPTTGTVVSDATAVDMNANLNFASQTELFAVTYKGAEAKTLTDGTEAVATIASSGGRVIIALGSVILAKGSSVGVKFTPPASNTSASVNCAIACYTRSSAVTGGETS
jgi:hypothetical protein